MNNLIKRIYEIMEANQQTFIDAGLQPIRTVDRYRGQTLNPEQFEIYEIPALFIGWRINWELQGKTYLGKCALDFHVVTDEPWGTSNVFTGFEDALEKAFFHKAVQKLLDGLESEDTTKLIRGTDTPVDTGVICYTILGYNCNIYDHADNNPSITIGDVTINLVKGNLKKALS